MTGRLRKDVLGLREGTEVKVVSLSHGRATILIRGEAYEIDRSDIGIGPGERREAESGGSET